MAFNGNIKKFESHNAQVLGVSLDSMKTLMQFADEHDINFPLISDKKEKLKNRYSKRRISYLIDKDGTIRLIQRGVPDNEVFLKKIQALERKVEN